MGDFIITHAGHVKSPNLGGKPRRALRPFWRRQFADQETLAQFIFDGTFGVVAPLLCLIFDPIVFRSGVYGEPPLLGRIRVFAYLVIFIEVTALLLWLVRARTPASARVLGGIMTAGGIFSLAVGVVIFPLSVIGILFLGIGLLGFTPFVTAIIYLRNGRRALRHAHTPPTGRRLAPVLLSAALTLALPAAAQWRVTRVMECELRVLTEGDAAQAAAATRQLKYVGYVALGEEFDQLVWAYGRETGDAARKARLANAYKELTGADIETRYNRLTD